MLKKFCNFSPYYSTSAMSEPTLFKVSIRGEKATIKFSKHLPFINIRLVLFFFVTFEFSFSFILIYLNFETLIVVSLPLTSVYVKMVQEIR